ncbi:MAG: tetratricopeptide repeat protein [Terriglobia bacterium]
MRLHHSLERSGRIVRTLINLRIGRLVFSAVLVCGCALLLPSRPDAQQASAHATPLSAAALAHFKTGEAAQKKKDYAQAEKEYAAVIASAPRFAPAYLNLGLVYQIEERWGEATRMLRKAVELDPRLAGAQFFLGVDDCLQGESRLAVPHLEAALRQKPDLQGGYSWLATAQKMNGDLEAEVATLRRGLGRYPNNVDMIYLLGRAYEMLGRDSIDRLEKGNPQSTYVQQWLGENYAQSGYPSAALVHLQNAIAASPHRPGLHVELGEVYLQAGNLDLAMKQFNAELEINPHDLRALTRRGEAELIQGHLNLALSHLAQALTVDPARVLVILGLRAGGVDESQANQLPPGLATRLTGLDSQLGGSDTQTAQLARAFIAAQQGHPLKSNALDAFSGGPSRTLPGACNSDSLKQWLARDQLNAVAICVGKSERLELSPALRIEVARALFIAGRSERAVDIMRALPSDPQAVPGAFYWRARCYKKLAVVAYIKLFQTAPNSYRAHELLGNIDSAREQDAQAIGEYKKALAENPALPNLHYEIGHLYWKVFKVEDARSELESELRLNPRHVGALLDMGSIDLYEHQPAKALSYLMRAASLDPANNNAHEFLGIAYLQLGKYAQAEAELRKASPSDRDGKVHYQLGKTYQALGEKEKAKQEFAAAAKLNLEASRKNQVRVQQLNTAGTSLQQP